MCVAMILSDGLFHYQCPRVVFIVLLHSVIFHIVHVHTWSGVSCCQIYLTCGGFWHIGHDAMFSWHVCLFNQDLMVRLCLHFFLYLIMSLALTAFFVHIHCIGTSLSRQPQILVDFSTLDMCTQWHWPYSSPEWQDYSLHPWPWSTSKSLCIFCQLVFLFWSDVMFCIRAR